MSKVANEQIVILVLGVLLIGVLIVVILARGGGGYGHRPPPPSSPPRLPKGWKSPIQTQSTGTAEHSAPRNAPPPKFSPEWWANLEPPPPKGEPLGPGTIPSPPFKIPTPPARKEADHVTVLIMPGGELKIPIHESDIYGTRVKALALVDKERNRQDAKWGEQNHEPPLWASILGEEYGEYCQAVNETAFDNGPAERMKGGTENMIKELTHVAAVAVGAIECLMRTEASQTASTEFAGLKPGVYCYENEVQTHGQEQEEKPAG